MKTIICYFIVSLLMSTISCVIKLEAIYAIRLICCCLNLVAIKLNKWITLGVLVHKFILLLEGVFARQAENITLFIIDQQFMEPIFALRHFILLWRVFNGVGFFILTYLQYHEDDSVKLFRVFLIPTMQLIPQLLSFIKYYYVQVTFTEEKKSNISPKLTTREYIRIKSKVDQDSNFVQLDLGSNLSGDLNRLIKKITYNQDQQFVIKEINAYQEAVWRLRMNAMPVGICIINNELNPKFMNKSLLNLINKTFFQAADGNFDILSHIFMNQLQFKKIHQPGLLDWPQSAQQRKESGNYNKQSISLIEDEVQTYTLTEVFQKLEDGSFKKSLTDLDNTYHILELVSIFESPIHNQKQIFLDCKVLFYDEENIDFMVIIQDFTKQNELLKQEEKNVFKGKVVQSFSHELRTPLNSATIFIKSALQDANLSQHAKIQYLQPCLQALKIQNHLINDIIDFSQINAKLLVLKFTSFKIQQIIDEISEQFKFQFQFKLLGLAFEVISPLSVTTEIKTDYQRLLQVLTNIIQNSLTYSEKGYVLVRISCIDLYEIKFSIQDEGIGLTQSQLQCIAATINQEQQQKQFKLWQGFGLIICQMLLRYIGPLNQNSILIMSEGQDRGTKVSFIVSNHIVSQTNEQAIKNQRTLSRQLSLPTLRAEQGLIILIKSKSPSKMLLAKTEFDDCDLSSSFVHQDDMMLTISQQKLTYSMLQELNQLKAKRTPIYSSTQGLSYRNSASFVNNCCNTILSVDDEVFNQKSLQLLLGQKGLEVDIVFNGRQAIERVMKPRKCCSTCLGYRLILMDCQMPIMDGWQTTRRLRDMMEKNLIPKVPIVGLTAFTSNEDIEKCKIVGMHSILHKPLEIDKFNDILQALHIYN